MAELTKWQKMKEIDQITVAVVKKYCSVKYPEGFGPARPAWHKWVYASGKKNG